MKIKIIKTGEIVERENGYALRLIEQGKATPAPQEDTKKPTHGGK